MQQWKMFKKQKMNMKWRFSTWEALRRPSDPTSPAASRGATRWDTTRSSIWRRFTVGYKTVVEGWNGVGCLTIGMTQERDPRRREGSCGSVMNKRNSFVGTPHTQAKDIQQSSSLEPGQDSTQLATSECTAQGPKQSQDDCRAASLDDREDDCSRRIMGRELRKTAVWVSPRRKKRIP